MNHCPRILSLDGGGVKGLSSLFILKEIMGSIRRKSQEEAPLPCKYFDLIGGTSTGGLIAIMLGRLGMVTPVSSVSNFSLSMNALRRILISQRRCFKSTEL
jgi:patatin-like phospholipase/acyl hydrolase